MHPSSLHIGRDTLSATLRCTREGGAEHVFNGWSCGPSHTTTRCPNYRTPTNRQIKANIRKMRVRDSALKCQILICLNIVDKFPVNIVSSNQKFYPITIRQTSDTPIICTHICALCRAVLSTGRSIRFGCARFHNHQLIHHDDAKRVLKNDQKHQMEFINQFLDGRYIA